MSVQRRSPPKMPQPEQWLSEHPFLSALGIIAVEVILIALFFALGGTR